MVQEEGGAVMQTLGILDTGSTKRPFAVTLDFPAATFPRRGGNTTGDTCGGPSEGPHTAQNIPLH